MTDKYFDPMPLTKCSPADIAKTRSGSVRHAQHKKAIADYRAWIESLFEGRPAFFCTLTFQQAINRGYCIERLDRGIIQREMHHLENRIQRAVFVRSRSKNNSRRKLIWRPTGEGGTTKRHHAHLIVECPEGWTLEKFQYFLMREWQKSKWAMRVQHVEWVDNISGIAGYTYKEGSDSILLPV